jgi:hypothetical protein
MIIMGDFNPKTGKEKQLMNVAGKYTIHNETCENGNLLGTVFNKENTIYKEHPIATQEISHGNVEDTGKELSESD